jgi:hypothetical protein
MSERRFFWITPYMGVAYDIYGKNERDARANIRKFLGVERLPNETQVWPA